MDTLDSIPDKPHFAIITSQSVSVPVPNARLGSYDDTVYAGSFLKYEAYFDRAMWESRIRELTIAHHQFKAIDVMPAKVEQHITITPRSRKA